ncbi:MAG: MBL fold metallo-hydrolase, partial [Firmicutes bacterium]|nr:MBL fold metallo-hydrolase [Bacillota bacterium]
EPDHSGSIHRFMEEFPAAKVVASVRSMDMIRNFFGTEFGDRAIAVKEKDTLALGSRTLTFYGATMVHWPEVIVTYDDKDKVLFSADAFGKFGALDVEEDWLSEARRYYIGIVGKFGVSVQTLLKKIRVLDIQTICSLHGPVLKENISYYIDKYNTWSSYEPEEDGILVAYTSIYGNTKKAVDLLVEELKTQGVTNVVVRDLARCDQFAATADAFRFSKLVLATTTYNGEIFPSMRTFIEHLTERGFQKRTVGFIENGSWSPVAMKVMKGLLEKSKDLSYTENNVKILSALNKESIAQVKVLAEELVREVEPTGEEESAVPAENTKKFVCKICGYVYEGEELPKDFICPLCKRGVEDFEEVK